MKIVVHGHKVGFSGKIRGFTRDSLGAHIIAAGGRFGYSPGKGMVAFLAGEQTPDVKVERAQALGVPVLQGEQIDAFLRDGEIDLDVHAGKQSFEALVGEARGLLAQPPSPASWLAITQLIDSCLPDHMDDLLAYLSPQLNAWPSCVVNLVPGASYTGSSIFNATAGELRQLPTPWLTEVLRGEDCPKYKLCKALNFDVTGLSDAICKDAFHNPALAHIEALGLGHGQKSDAFYGAMAHAPCMPHVHTLVLDEMSQAGVDTLLALESLPALTSLHLPYERQPGPVVDLCFGPWASQLTTLGLLTRAQIARVASRRHELPCLQHLAISLQYIHMEDWDHVASTHLPSLVRGITRLTVEIFRYHDLGKMLDMLAGSSVCVLDLRPSPLAFEGATGAQFIQAHVVNNGLSRQLERVFVNDQTCAKLCENLRAHGIEVESPHQRVAPPKPSPVAMEVAPGEVERRERNEVHVHDAMLCEEPGFEAWYILVGVVNGLELQLDPEAFEEALCTLEAHLEAWPDHLRILPSSWWRDAWSDQGSPKLRLVRALHHDAKNQGKESRQASMWLTRMSESTHVQQAITHFELVGYRGHRHTQQAVISFFKAVRPSSFAFADTRDPSRDALISMLHEAEVLPDREIPCTHSLSYHGVRHPWLCLDDARTLKQMYITIDSFEALEALLQCEETEHVVTLTLRVTFEPQPHHHWSALQVKLSRWTSLRYLAIQVKDTHPYQLLQRLSEWLSQARPVHINARFSGTYLPVPMLHFIRAGLYSRAYGSCLTLSAQMQEDDVLPFLGHTSLNVAMIHGGRQHTPHITTSALIAHMHPRLRANLRALKWHLSPREYGEVDTICALLPRLSEWLPMLPDDLYPEQLPAILEALGSAPRASALPRVHLHATSLFNANLTRAQLATLAHGCGVKSEALSWTGYWDDFM